MRQRFSGLAYRAHDPKWSFAPTSGQGAALTGGRFNPRGMATLYLSLSQIGALLESQQGFKHKAQPKLICSYQVDTQQIADLTNSATLTHYDIAPELLACAWMLEDKPYTHEVATRLIAAGVTGILVPSFAVGAQDCTNLVLWQWGEQPPFRVSVIDDNGALPKNQRSWQ